MRRAIREVLCVVGLAIAAMAGTTASSTGAAYPDPIKGFTKKRISSHELPPLMRTSMRQTYAQGGKHWLLKGSTYPPFATPSAGTCWVCDEFRFIYVRIGKTGSTTMTRSYLAGVSEMVGGPARFEVDCMRIPRYKFLHYFVFTVVRNPWDRALSQFLACFQRNLDVDDHDTRAIFGEWCWNPFGYGGPGYCNGLNGFEKRPLGGATPLLPATIHQKNDDLMRERPNEHLGFQYPTLCTAQHECVVDYVAHLETLEQDMREVVDAINHQPTKWGPPRHNITMPYYNSSTHRADGVDTRDASGQVERRDPCSYKTYFNDFPHCRQALRDWFQEDIERLGYTFDNGATCQGRHEHAADPNTFGLRWTARQSAQNHP